MAFVKRDDNEQDPNAQPTTGAGEGSTITAGGQGGAAGSAANAAPTAPVAKPGTTGSGMFDNVGRYLDVNADKAKGLANRVTGVLDRDVGRATSAIGDATNQFNKAVEGGTVQQNQGVINDALKNAQQVAADKDRAAQVQAQYNANYAGPTDFTQQDYYNNAARAVGNATSSAQLANTEEGRKELLARANPGRASGGVLSLNNAILQNSADAQNLIANSARGASGLDKRLEDAAKAAGIYAQRGQDITKATRDAARGAFDQAYGQFRTDAENKANAALGNERTAAQTALNAFNAGSKLSPSQLSLLGITQDQADSFRKGISDYQAAVDAAKGRDKAFGADRNAFANLAGLKDDKGGYGSVQDGAGFFNASNVASADDYARLAALNELSGRGENFLTDASLAGTAPKDLLDFRFSDLQKRLADATAAANAVKQVQAVTGGGGGVPIGDIGGGGEGGGLIQDILGGDPGQSVPALKVLEDLARKGGEGVKENLERAGGAASNLWKTALSAADKAGVDIDTAVRKLGTDAKQALVNAPQNIQGFLSNPVDTSVNAAKTAAKDIKTAAQVAGANVNTAAKTAGKDVSATTKKATTDTKKAVATGAKDTAKEATKTLDTSKKATGKAAEDTKKEAAIVADKLKAAAANPGKAIAQNISGLFGGNSQLSPEALHLLSQLQQSSAAGQKVALNTDSKSKTAKQRN